MKILPAILALCLTGCATSTKLFNNEGQEIVHIGSDAKGVNYQNGSISFSAVELAPSKTIGAAGRAIRMQRQ